MNTGMVIEITILSVTIGTLITAVITGMMVGIFRLKHMIEKSKQNNN